MSHVAQMLSKQFMNIRPGQVAKFDGEFYVAKPRNSIWFRIEDLEEIRSILKNMGFKNFTPRFRGPRITAYSCASGYRRSAETMRSVCLKEDAKFFTIHSR